MKVYVVKQYPMCECDTPCSCICAEMLACFWTKKAADAYAEKRYKAWVDEEEVRSSLP